MANPADAPLMVSDTKRATVMNVENIFKGSGGGWRNAGQRMGDRMG